MKPLASVYAIRSWHAVTLAPVVPTTSAVEPRDSHAGTVHAATPASSATPSANPLRDPQAAAAFCDTFNAGENLAPADLSDKIDLMCSSPLKLARCMPALFMSDVLGPYADLAELTDRPAPVLWISGDCHLGNFGIVRSRHDHAVWGINDHDMACKGSPAMDLERLAFSLVSAMRERDLSGADTSRVVGALAKAYHGEMGDIADGDGGMAYLNEKQADGAVRKLIEKTDQVKRDEWLRKFAEPRSDGHWRFVYSDKVERVDTATSRAVTDALHAYDHAQGATPSVARPLHVLGVAQKMQSGGSSHGQPRYLALVESADPEAPPVILEVKQELPAPLVGWNGDNAAAIKASKAHWTGNLHEADAGQAARGQLAMGGDQNPLTGSTSIDGISYLVRERDPFKAALKDEQLGTVDDFVSVAEQAGMVLALAHGRSADQAKAVVAWMGDVKKLSRNLDAFAQAYASQAEADLVAYRQAHPQASPTAGRAVPDSGD